MEKIKFSILCILGLLCLIYNLTSGFLVPQVETILILLGGQIDARHDSLLGTIFDYFIKFVFTLDLNDPKTYFRLFGV